MPWPFSQVVRNPFEFTLVSNTLKVEMLMLSYSLESLTLDSIDDSAAKSLAHGTNVTLNGNVENLGSLKFLSLINCECIHPSSLIEFVESSKLKGLSLGGSLISFNDNVPDTVTLKEEIFKCSKTLEFLDVTFLQHEENVAKKNLWDEDFNIIDLVTEPGKAVRVKQRLLELEDRNVVRETFTSMMYAKGKVGNPLHFLTRQGEVDLVRDIINLGCDVNAVDHSCNTALLLASNLGYTEIVKVLLASGASESILRKNRKADSPLYISCLKGFSEIVRLILVHTPRDKFQNLYDDRMYHNSWSPGIVACISRSVDVLRTLLEYGFDLNRPNAYGSTPLHVCATKDFYDGAKLLVSEAKVDINPRDELKQTPLDRAIAQKSSAELVSLLEAAGGRRSDRPNHHHPSRFGKGNARGRGRGRGRGGAKKN
jgi:ankyrin repeat protein